jgi:N-acyl-D-amino-acid deacylase
MSLAPLRPERKDLLRTYVGEAPYAWESFGEFLEALQGQRPSTNVACGVGHGTIRIACMGFDPRKASSAELADMKAMLDASLSEGAWFLSSGLIYPPGEYADEAELTELAKVAASRGTFYATHMRNENLRILEALPEAIRIAENSGAGLQVSHHKLAHRKVWGLSRETLRLIEEARSRGVDAWADQYPYVASSTYYSSNVPGWAFEGGVGALKERLRDPALHDRIAREMAASHEGRWGDIFLGYADAKEDKPFIGKSTAEIADLLGTSPEEACLGIVERNGNDASEVNFGMCEEDVERIMAKPYVCIGSDGWAYDLDYPGKPHPRSFGAFPRVLGHYCRERGLFSLEEAVRKMTGLPAQRMGFADRGLLREGFWADLCLFDPARVRDDPTYADPCRPCSGIERVYVNGALTALRGVHTGARAGQVLRR